LTAGSAGIARLTIHAPRPLFSAPAPVQARLDRAPFTGGPAADMVLRMPVELQDAVAHAEPAAHLQHLHRFADHPSVGSSGASQQPPSAAAAVAASAPSSNAAGAKGVDIAQLADHVYRILVRKLNNERDRRGY